MKFLKTTKYLILDDLRDKQFVFWIVFFPIFLLFMFNLSTASVRKNVDLSIKIAVEDKFNEKNSHSVEALKSIEVFELSIKNEKDAKSELSDSKIDVFLNKDYELIFKKKNILTNIAHNIIEDVKKTSFLIKNGASFKNIRIENKDRPQDDTVNFNFSAIMFYSLFAYISLYTIYGAISACEIGIPSSSELALRISVSPVSRFSLLISKTLSSFILVQVSNLILLLIAEKVLKLNLINNFWGTYRIILLGNFLGYSMGIFLGSFSKLSTNLKTIISTASLIILASLSGMMGTLLSKGFEDALPIFSKYNPQKILTKMFYQTNLFENSKSFTSNVLIIFAFSAVFLILGYFNLRRQNYDSI